MQVALRPLSLNLYLIQFSFLQCLSGNKVLME